MIYPRVAIVCALIVCAAGARAQSGWEARVTMAPNPLPGGRCGGIVVEVVDDHGYRRSTLSNGATVDSRNYKFAISDPSHVTIQNDASVSGRVCADTNATASTITVTVTLPDGLAGTLQIALVSKGTVGLRAVVYRPQAPLRIATSPEFAPGFVPSAVKANTGGANGAGSDATLGAASTTSPPANERSAVPSRITSNPLNVRTPAATKFTTPALTMAGTYHVPPSAIVTASNLAMRGTYHIPPAVTVTTSNLAMRGTYHVPPAVTVTTSSLAMRGTYHIPPALTVTTLNLEMSGSYPALSAKVSRYPRRTGVKLPETHSP